MNFSWNSFFDAEAFHDQAEECCELGRLQAETSHTCTMNLHLVTDEHQQNRSANCRFLSHICCLANLRSYFCEEGLKTALRLLPCHQTKFESKDSYQVISIEWNGRNDFLRRGCFVL